MPKPGPKPNNAASKTAGAKGGKSRPSLKRGSHKQGARTGRPTPAVTALPQGSTA